MVTKKDRDWLMVRVQERGLAYVYKGQKEAGKIKQSEEGLRVKGRLA
jgi:hypothetical protein